MYKKLTMNTTQLKRFAAEARNKLREGVKGRLIRLGFDLKTGEVPENLRPVAVENAGVWRGKAVSNNFMYNWNELYNHIKQIGIKQMIEEGAYTWFNRFVAIRILAKNNLCDAVLQYVDSARTPRIVDEARTGRIPPMSDEQRQHLDELLEDDRLVTEQFAVLINAWVNNNPIISTCFDADSKHFMELLLPDDIRNEGGFLDMLNSADFISDEDYRSPELIGWLYQFYISERKDEVFAKKGKYNADEIAPATQIFTPNWIVKYMVQNTVGRIYLTGREVTPDLQRLAEKWKYLVEPSYSEKEDKSVLPPSELEDLRVADLACGSGHILNECFDLLYELYIHEGYSRREAITNIFEHNLTGIDIDLRAKQLATFALLLKACQRDSSFADAHCLPKVLCTSESLGGQASLPVAVNDAPQQVRKELTAAFALLQHADVLGSIMKFDLSPETRQWLKDQIASATTYSRLTNTYNLLLALTEKYDAIVMNPPYMPCNKIDALNKYVNTNYREGKADLFAVFMQVCMNDLVKSGRMAMINMQSWMFLSSYESLRELFLKEYTLSSMLHLGPRTFDELSGEVVQNTAFVFDKSMPSLSTEGIYYRLVDGKDCADKERMFISEGFRYKVPQTNFEKIPSAPITYWMTKSILQKFQEFPTIGKIAEVKIGMGTGKNEIFVREWYEVSNNDIDKSLKTISDLDKSSAKYFPYNKGGQYRRWYGNLIEVLWFNEQGRKRMNEMSGHRENGGYNRYCNAGLTWSFISSNNFGIRYLPSGCFFDVAGSSLFATSNLGLESILGFLASKVCYNILKMLNPTINFQAGNIKSLPIPPLEDSFIINLTKRNITISKEDWDAHETSWDFQGNEIVGMDMEEACAIIEEPFSQQGMMVSYPRPEMESLEFRTDLFKKKWERKFFQLHANEEELNRRFIEIYGLQDELTPDVPLNEVTILQQGEISIWKEGDPIPREVKNGTVEFSPIVWHDDVLMKQLISYAVGCMMGRYRLDRPGLAVAHPNPTPEELEPYPLGGRTLLSSNNNPFLERNKEINQTVAGNLPHWHQDGKLQFVTFRLADSLPKERREELEAQRKAFLASHPEPWSDETKKEYQKTFSKRVEQWLDNGYGSCMLKDETIAKIVEDCLYYYDGKQYIIHGYVIMPNHVHVLVETIDGYKLSEILKSWKGVSARKINGKMGKAGQVWMEESFDRLIRNEQHYNNVIDYINKNIRQGGVRYWNGGQECPPSQYFDIDDDAIIPLMPADCGFYDNATQRMSDFVRQVFGADMQTENLNYIEKCLGKSIEQYFIKDFWKDHKKMYQNRPIYWLFSSKKGAFQVITYMHRMTPYTVERIRAKYLLPYIETLTNRITELQTREDALSTAESKRLDSLQKQLEECREYHDRLAVVAERAIGFDLDDGVLHNYALYGDILAKLK